MLFNSIDFAVFLPVVFILYWYGTRGNRQLQNYLIIVASYVFYGWWDWKFLSLIFFSTMVDYSVGRALTTTDVANKRKALLWVSIVVNLGFLGFFKYYNFFLDNFTSAFHFLGYQFKAESLEIVLPVGISFYTFQTLSYTIDVYRGKLEPTKDFAAFMAFVCFFPQLVAGPIERASNLLPQFFRQRTFDYTKAVDGLRQILWGLFKKVVIADNCAFYANLIFNNSDQYSGLTLLLGAIFFAFQIYGDFSGYSDIAIGTSRLFGFDLKRNFAFPYFSRDIAEFWRRWHISLSTWFRDYLYIPLGGSRGGTWTKVRNTFIIFLVSGFWHGANWTFIVWGALNAIYFLPLLLAKRNRSNVDNVASGKLLPSIQDSIRMAVTFGLTCIAWVFFRADDVSHAYSYLVKLFYGLIDLSAYLRVFDFIETDVGYLFPTLIVMFLLVEWIGRETEFAMESIYKVPSATVRIACYLAVACCILLLAGDQQEFIYFQF